MKTLICIGDSWTFGVGDNVNHHLHSWPSVLSSLTNYNVVNLGEGGASNYAAYINLMQYISKINHGDVTVLFLLSGYDRFGLYKRNNNDTSLSRTYYPHCHLKYMNSDKFHDQLEKEFLEIASLYCLENENDNIDRTALDIINIQNLCQNKQFKFLFGSAFYPITIYENSLHHQEINWNNNIHNILKYTSMLEFLCGLENIDCKTWSHLGFQNNYKNKNGYFSSCGHPSIKGYDAIANELLKVL